MLTFIPWISCGDNFFMDFSTGSHRLFLISRYYYQIMDHRIVAGLGQNTDVSDVANRKYSQSPATGVGLGDYIAGVIFKLVSDTVTGGGNAISKSAVWFWGRVGTERCR